MEWITMEKVGTYIHGCKLRKKEDLLKGTYHYAISNLHIPDQTVKVTLDAPLVVEGVVEVKSLYSKNGIRTNRVNVAENIEIEEGDLLVANGLEAGGNISVDGYICARVITAGGYITTDMGIRAASVTSRSVNGIGIMADTVNVPNIGKNTVVAQ